MESPLLHAVIIVLLWNVVAEKSTIYDNNLLVLLSGPVSVNNNTSIETCIWPYIRQKLMSPLIIDWLRSFFHNSILSFIKTRFFMSGIPFRYSKTLFCHFSIYDFDRSIEEWMLITNIILFFYIHRVIRDISNIFKEPKNQFLAWKIINITCMVHWY